MVRGSGIDLRDVVVVVAVFSGTINSSAPPIHSYFRQGDFFGAACYEKLEILSDVERGVRMKSVGMIVAHFPHLHPHLPRLAQLVRCVDVALSVDTAGEGKLKKAVSDFRKGKGFRVERRRRRK